MKYYHMPMHLHSVHQPGASMESHIYNAAQLGMEYIRFTDHDTRTGRKSRPVKDFDFSKGLLKYEEGDSDYRGWEPVGEPSLNFDGASLEISSVSGCSGVRFVSSGKRHTWALLSDISLTVGMEYKRQDNARIIFDITLSQRPPEHEQAHFRYVIGDVKEESTHLFKEVAMPLPNGDLYTLNLSDDLECEVLLGGLDNTFATLSILIDGNAEVKLKRFEIDNKYEYNDLILRQRALADEIGKKYHIKPFVTTEISGAGQHKNCFTSSVPIIDYFERDYIMSEEESCEYLRSFGAVFSYNHPFEAERYKRKKFTREQIENIISLETDKLSAVNVYGAQVMEVGFPEGRGQFSLQDYLRLWDNLSLRGVFITGDGDSDSHYSNQSWFEGNNFVTWIGADENLKFPISEETFNASLLSGNCYMGDPTALCGGVDFRCAERMMGSAIRADDSTYEVSLSIEKVKSGWSVRYIKDGECVRVDNLNEGNYRESCIVTPDKDISFIRAELYNEHGRCIMLTNPIYFVEPHYRGFVPGERAGYIGSSAQERDKSIMSAVYDEDIEIPCWLDGVKGKKILHVGDTESWRYRYYRKLIDIVKPDVIIHTGDMADEVKAGRMTETRAEYEFKITEMCRILRESGAEIIIVPGNNDIEEIISRLIPEAKIVHTSTKLSLDGVECRVGHEVFKMTFDTGWSFYGHGYTGDEWDPSMNKEGGELRFNACTGPVICSLSERKYYQFSLENVK